jgi:uncharacterized protein YukE
VTGDTAALGRAAAVWHDQGVALNAVTRELKAAAVDLPEEWAGQASAAFGEFMAAIAGALTELAGQMGQTQQVLEDAAKEAAFAHDFIVMIIREVVEWVAGNIVADAITLGLATAAEAPITAAYLAKRVKAAEEAASKLAIFYRSLKKILDSLKDLKSAYRTAKGFERLKKFTTLAKDFDTVLDAGKLRNLRLFSDGKAAKLADLVWGRAGMTRRSWRRSSWAKAAS